MGATASPAPRAGLCRFPPWGSPGHPPRCGLERRWGPAPSPLCLPHLSGIHRSPSPVRWEGQAPDAWTPGLGGVQAGGASATWVAGPGPPRGSSRPCSAPRCGQPGAQSPHPPVTSGLHGPAARAPGAAVTFHVRFLSLGVIQEDRGTGTLITGVPEPSPCPRPWPAPSRNQRECLGATRSHAASLPAPLAAAARLRPSSHSEDAGQREGCHLPRGACARAGRSRREGRRGFRPCCPGFPLVASEGLRAD